MDAEITPRGALPRTTQMAVQWDNCVLLHNGFENVHRWCDRVTECVTQLVNDFAAIGCFKFRHRCFAPVTDNTRVSLREVLFEEIWNSILRAEVPCGAVPLEARLRTEFSENGLPQAFYSRIYAFVRLA